MLRPPQVIASSGRLRDGGLSSSLNRRSRLSSHRESLPASRSQPQFLGGCTNAEKKLDPCFGSDLWLAGRRRECRGKEAAHQALRGRGPRHLLPPARGLGPQGGGSEPDEPW